MADNSPEEVHVPAEVATGDAGQDVTDLTERDFLVAMAAE